MTWGTQEMKMVRIAGVWIRTDAVEAVEPDDSSKDRSCVYLAGGHTVKVDETSDRVAHRLYGSDDA